MLPALTKTQTVGNQLTCGRVQVYESAELVRREAPLDDQQRGDAFGKGYSVDLVDERAAHDPTGTREKNHEKSEVTRGGEGHA